ncbi:MAG: ATP/GTP-binding protein [Chitinophagales bacterium]
MQKSILIKNYKLFKHLEIDNLKRVNLFIGKNNTGKSTLLEAIAGFFFEEQFLFFLYNQFYRKEWRRQRDNLEDIVEGLSVLFYDRKIKIDKEKVTVFIGSNEKEGISFYISDELDENEHMKQPNFIWEYHQNNENKLVREKWKLEQIMRRLSFQGGKSLYIKRNCKLVESSLKEHKWEELAIFWGNIALSDKEDYVIEALQIIEPKINRLTFIDTNTNSKKAIVKISGNKEPISLNTMGDGISRILQIILNLVHCENGILLIDEFENGLHWSIQKDLWQIILKMSEKLNIQVFAATHSRDTIWALQQVRQNDEDTAIIKLKHNKKTGMIKSVPFSTDEINIALEQAIEIR